MLNRIPTYTQDWINLLYYKMITKTVSRVIASSTNGMASPWDPMWIPYNYGVYDIRPIPLQQWGSRLLIYY